MYVLPYISICEGDVMVGWPSVFRDDKTDIPWYDNMMENPDYFRENKGVTFELEIMPPSQYLNACAMMQDSDMQRQYGMVDQEQVEALRKLVEGGTKLYLPILDYADRLQEGRHRAVLAESMGIEMPVLIVKSAKTASLWDVPRPTLDPEVWEESGQLKPTHRNFLLDYMKRKLEGEGFTAHDEWVDSVVFLGSLAGFQYNPRSDADLHVVVDLDRLAQLEYNGGISREKAHDLMQDLRKQINKTPENLPGTKHPIEMTFHYQGYETPRMPTNVGMYDLIADKWETEPTGKDLSPVAAEKLYPELMDAVYGLAEKYKVQVMEMRQDVVDVEYLREALTQFPPKYRPVIEGEITEKIDQLNWEIEDYLSRTDQLVEERHGTPYPVMPAELQFKYLSRYGYLWLRKQLQELDQVEESDLPKLEKTLQEVPKLAG